MKTNPLSHELLRKMNAYWRAANYLIVPPTAAVMTPWTELCRREDAERLYGEMSNG